MDKVRRHYVFYGNVQGVGFRYTASCTARSYGISGWVQNLGDGSVEMEAEGRPIDLDHLTQSLENLRWSSVDRIESKDIPLHGGYDFEIK